MLGGTDWLRWKWHNRRHDSTYESGWVNRSCSLPNGPYPTFHFQSLRLLVKPAHRQINGSLKTTKGWVQLMGILTGGRSCAGPVLMKEEVGRNTTVHQQLGLRGCRQVIWNGLASSCVVTDYKNEQNDSNNSIYPLHEVSPSIKKMTHCSVNESHDNTWIRPFIQTRPGSPTCWTRPPAGRDENITSVVEVTGQRNRWITNKHDFQTTQPNLTHVSLSR